MFNLVSRQFNEKFHLFSTGRILNKSFAALPLLNFWNFRELLWQRTNTMLLHDHSQPLEIFYSMFELSCNNIELSMNAFAALLTKYTKSYSAAAYRRYMSFEQVKFGCDIPFLALHDLLASC